MKKLLSVPAALLAGTAGPIAAGVSDAHAGTVQIPRIMPLGDSITWGTGSSTTSTYRADLWNQVTAAGCALDFVGGSRSGALPDDEGHPGWRIDQIADLAPGGVAGSRPNVVTLHLGTNDMSQDHQVATAPQRLGSLVDQLLAAFFDGLQAAIGAGWVTEPAPPTAGCVTGAIRGVQSGRCLDVHGGSQSNGALVGLWDCTEGVPQQQWTTTAAREVQVDGGRCLDAVAHGTPNATALEIWTCTGGANQKWSR